ncbi:Imidazolonepropionase [Pseudoxanthomonas sp. GM95]|uniref:amidohydrolase family protein n=1 Tax=Pseudoxanthomonas sp. GM95 TaxID=1881043 RepID=UPI0008D1846B|nr:amidohydrolase family protein [Pseudoxanthomonas sp. GM95]SEK87939.1 Imidazolonepropionase [Pseudoxanthomonas sp. GM95]
MRLSPRLLSLGIACLLATQAQAETVVLEGARVFDGNRDAGVQTLVITDGVITTLGKAPATLPGDAKRIDYRGRWIIPGLVSNHSHLGNTNGTEHGDRHYTRAVVLRDLKQFQRFGVTTLTALGMNGPAFFALRKEVHDQPRLGAQLYGAGAGIGVPEGAPPAGPMGLASDPVARPATPEQARAAVRQQKADGVDLIKLWVDNLGDKAPIMPEAIYQAAIAEAHAQDLKVAAHIHDQAPAAELVASGVDIIGHGIRDTPVAPTLVQAMHDAGTWYIPTLTIDENTYAFAEHPQWLQDRFIQAALPASVKAQWSAPGWADTQRASAGAEKARRDVAMNLRNLRTLHDGGVRIGFGTDAGAMPSRVIGYSEHRELELMTQAGFTAQQALTTATRDAAQLLGLDDRGTLAAGKRADLVVLEADPLADIRNTRGIQAVWQAGQQVAGPVLAMDHAPVAAD